MAIHHQCRFIFFIVSIVACLKSLASDKHVDTLSDWKFIKGQAQGTTYLIRYLPSHSLIEKEEIDSLLTNIDLSLSLYRPDSKISAFNLSHSSFPSDLHLSTVLKTSLAIQHLSNGAFDIRLFKLSQAWGFGPKPAKRPPHKRTIHRLKPKSSDSVWIADNMIFKSYPELNIDLDGIAQGYSVDLIASFLEQRDVRNFMVELGGEIRTSGHRPDGTLWRIGIESPVNSEMANTLMVSPGNGAITTSGSYRKTRSFGGRIYSHVINPYTGRPIENGMLACTVLAPTAMMADALDNVGMVLGPEEFLKLIDGLSSVDAFLVWQDKNGKIRSAGTKGFHQKIVEQVPSH